MRGNTGPKIDLKGVSVTLVIALVVIFVGFQVMSTVTDEQLQQMDKQEMADTCMGIVCSADEIPGFLGVIGTVIVLAVIIANLTSIRGPPDDEVKETKRLYVEGEIGILELEERLDDEIDDE